MQIALLAACLTLFHAPAAGAAQRVLIVGGGPDLQHNQVAIESNVRYVMRVLPKEDPVRVLFANGDPTAKTVLYEGERRALHHRAPEISKIDGPARIGQVKDELARAASGLAIEQPVFLYFTGHGSPNGQAAFANNQFDLWNGEAMSVRDLAVALKGYPKKSPVTVLMVQCFSGAFGNILFEQGDPTGALTGQPVCGFFASIAQRPAAGCTPEVNEANYRDFTSYFVAALTGTDRVGRAVTGVDYNHDGKVGMNEAFAYSLIHDDSIDTPVCTSDVFLRRFVTTPEDQVFATPYSSVLEWGALAQKAVLEALAGKLGFPGEDRLGKAYAAFKKLDLGSEKDWDVELIRFVRLAKSVILAHQLRATGDKSIQQRYEELLKLEGGNPFVQ